jgi:hypothetical protein
MTNRMHSSPKDTCETSGSATGRRKSYRHRKKRQANSELPGEPFLKAADYRNTVENVAGPAKRAEYKRMNHDHIAEFIAPLRSAAWTYAIIGIFGMVLASAGLAGMTAYSVVRGVVRLVFAWPLALARETWSGW